MTAWLSPYPPSVFGKVAVLMGGHSAEREISLKSGQVITAALQRQNINAEAIDVDKEIIQKLLAGQFDRVFIALHGRGGEDGSIQGALETIGLPFTGSKVLACALAMDKYKSKQVWQSMGLPTAPYLSLTAVTNWQSVVDTLGLPLMVKPIYEGSSLGASQVNSTDELASAFKSASAFGSVMVEQWISGSEYTAAILDDVVLPLLRLEVAGTFYDHHAKYESKDTEYLFSTGLTDIEQQRFSELALSAFKGLGLESWGRIDFIVSDDGPQLLEANTVPGMTSQSLVPRAALQAGLEFDALAVRILASTLGCDVLIGGRYNG